MGKVASVSVAMACAPIAVICRAATRKKERDRPRPFSVSYFHESAIAKIDRVAQEQTACAENFKKYGGHI